MRRNRIKSMLLMAGLALSMTACSAGEEPAGTTASAQKTEAGGVDISKEVTLRIYGVGNEGDKYREQVYERINEITKEKINAKIEVNMLSWGDYLTKLPAILASGEDYDLTYTSSWCLYRTEGPKGAFYELTEDMLTEYMPKTYAEYPAEAWEEAKLGGKIYMIPTVTGEFDSHGLIVRKDLREKYGVPEIKTQEDLGVYFAAIKENEPGITPFKGQSTDNMDTMFCFYGIDQLGAGGVVRAGLQTPMDDLANLKCKIDIPEIRDYYKKMGEWYKAGYIANDILSSKTSSEDYFKAGQSSVMTCNINNASEKRKMILIDNPDWDLEYVDFEGDTKVQLSSYISNGMAVGRNSKNPERALMFMELCFQDEELYNLINYGLEGTTYVINEDGTVGTPEGVSSQEIQMDNLSMGIRYEKFEKQKEGVWEEIEDRKDDYAKRTYNNALLKVNYQLDELSAELAALNNVFDQYEMPLRWGVVEATDSTLNDLRQKYTDAGVDKVLEVLNRQIKEQTEE